MSKLFYPKLAVINIKKNSKTYAPFILTCICTIIMFYIMHSMSINSGLNKIVGSSSLKLLLSFGTKIIAIFSAIFLFYTNSFLIKRRKKEIGLYNVLGLEKKHIAKILFFECIFTSAISLTFGIALGIIFDKLMFLLLIKILSFKVVFGFSISVPSIIKTLIVFGIIFLATLLSNLFQIKILKPIDLLKGSNQGEKEPKSKLIITIIGLAALLGGYGIALNVDSPLKALTSFFIAVILVMIGTYALFTSGSISMLKMLRRNKTFYYKTNHFISVSGMMYRMKQNAIGLANICILSTAVLVMLSTTTSLYAGMEDILKIKYPRELSIKTDNLNKANINKINNIINQELKSNKLTTKDEFHTYSNSITVVEKSGNFLSENGSSNNQNSYLLVTIPISDYNRIENKNVTLKDNEALLFSKTKGFKKTSITIDNKTFNIKEKLNTPLNFSVDSMTMTDVIDTYVLFVNDINFTQKNSSNEYTTAFNLNGTEQDISLMSDKLNKAFSQNTIHALVSDSVSGKQDFSSGYGGLFFIGIFLGVLFLMATVLIIYYKQISEGFEDKERFKILQKVGMDKREIKKTIRSQVLMVFFLPLVFTIIHIAFAFPMMSKLLALLMLENINLFIFSTAATILIFVVIYTIVFLLTAKSYYKIVE